MASMPKNPPEWFELAEAATPETMSRVAEACQANGMGLQVKLAPSLAHWFMADSLLLANRANREGMHANALALTRQCIEAVGVIELNCRWQAFGTHLAQRASSFPEQRVR
jgi:hypothetical protein